MFIIPIAAFSQVDSFSVMTCEAKTLDTSVIYVTYFDSEVPQRTFGLFFYVVGNKPWFPKGAKIGLKRKWLPGEIQTFTYNRKKYQYFPYRPK